MIGTSSASLQSRPSLLSRYETLRRKEFEYVTGLLDTLGTVDSLPAEQLEQARDAMFHADHPYLTVLIGAFNTGKSSIINALIGQDVLNTGAIPTTNKIAILRYGEAPQQVNAGDVDTVFHPSPLLEKVSFVDTPGLESIFTEHDTITRKFLHRADIVLFVMLATQAMTAKNVEALQSLRAYGKKIVIVVNQIDLIDPDERETLRTFITEQSRQHLGYAPDVWMVSARIARAAHRTDSDATSGREELVDEILWNESGFAQIEAFINNALSDAERVRQKLETPLQIVRNVTSAALAQTRQQQDSLADYRRSAQNVRGQIDAGLREQQTLTTEARAQLESAFNDTAKRGRDAIHELFTWSRAFSLVTGGIAEATGLARIFRRFGATTPAKAAFDSHHVFEPLQQVPVLTDALAPRLEGRDMKDAEDLVGYTRRELDRLPDALRAKLIGSLNVPTTYDRTHVPKVRGDLTTILTRANEAEFKRIDSSVRGSIALLGLYELLVIVLGLGITIAAISAGNTVWPLTLLITLLLAGVGFLIMPLRGALMEADFGRRIRALADEYWRTLSPALESQIGFGRRLREDAAAPFLRLIETQIERADQQRKQLESHEQQLTQLEKELGTLR